MIVCSGSLCARQCVSCDVSIHAQEEVPETPQPSLDPAPAWRQDQPGEASLPGLAKTLVFGNRQPQYCHHQSRHLEQQAVSEFQVSAQRLPACQEELTSL